ncbi:MAG: hypothetical protein ACXQTP_02075 [Candidatus Methanofastidiosia archaeon]
MVLINPFTKEAKKHLKIDLNDIEKSLIRLAIGRANEKNMKKYLDLDEREDVISLYLLMQSLAKTPHSPEVMASLASFEKLMKRRIRKYFSSEIVSQMKTLIEIHETTDLKSEETPFKKDIFVESANITVPKEDIFRLKRIKRNKVEYLLKWNEIYDVVDITKYYVTSSYVLVTRNELIQIYAKILRKACYDYILKTSEKIKNTSHPIYEKIANMVKNVVKTTYNTENVSKDLSGENFPPCIRLALAGVSSGQRNYGITILLTSFLSYARIMPSTKIFDRQSSFTLSQKEVQILLDDVIPEIIKAGDKCEPPFFKEQPLEKLNILYHLGFGMTKNPTVADHGKSKWYLPPSCSKIRENAPSLCQPDEFCKEISWNIIDKGRVDKIIKKSETKKKKTLGELILKKLETMGPKSIGELSSEFGARESEILSFLKMLTKNDLVGKREIRNPLIYYIRKKKRFNQKP